MKKTFHGLLVFAGVGLLVSGCATKSFVQEEIRGAELRQQQTLELRHGELNSRMEGIIQSDGEREARYQSVSSRVGSMDERLGSFRKRFDSRKELVNLDEGTVFFGFDSYALSDDARGVLDQLADRARLNREIVLAVEGHADTTGSRDYNLELSEKRARSVFRYLVMERNVEMTRIFSLGFGEADPSEENATREGRQANRRVSVLLLGPTWARDGADSDGSAGVPRRIDQMVLTD